MSELETEIRQVTEALFGPAWDYERAPGFCTLLQTPADRRALFRNADESTRTFIEETDFEAAALLYVESVGPTSCFDVLEFGNLAVDPDGSVLVGNATAIDTSGRLVACNDVLTYPAAMVRVTATPRPRGAAIKISDGMGRTDVVRSRDGGRPTDDRRFDEK